jgi:hypothetical protein
MSLPSNGIPPEVIRETMPPYSLSADLLAATFAAVPAPLRPTPPRPGGWSAPRGWCRRSPG